MRFFARTVFFAYLLLVICAVAVVFLDSPSGPGWSGIIALIVAFVVGLPWNAILWLFAKSFFMSDELAVALCFVGIAINLWLVTRWAFRESLPRVAAALFRPGTPTLVNAVVRPVALGVAAYFATLLGVGFFLINVRDGKSLSLLIGAFTVPFLVSGYVGARFTVSAFRARRASLGVASALVGFATPYVFVDLPGEAWMWIALVLGAAIAAAVGAWFGALSPPSTALVGRTPDA